MENCGSLGKQKTSLPADTCNLLNLVNLLTPAIPQDKMWNDRCWNWSLQSAESHRQSSLPSQKG